MRTIIKSSATTSIVLVVITLMFEVITGDEIPEKEFILWGSVSAVFCALGLSVAQYNPDDNGVKLRLKQGLAGLFFLPPLVIILLGVKMNTVTAIVGAAVGGLCHFAVWHFYFYRSSRAALRSLNRPDLNKQAKQAEVSDAIGALMLLVSGAGAYAITSYFEWGLGPLTVGIAVLVMLVLAILWAIVQAMYGKSAHRSR